MIMTAVSVDLKRFGLNGSYVDSQDIHSKQKEKAVSCVSSYFLNRPDVKSYLQRVGKRVDFDLSFGKGGATITFKGDRPQVFTDELPKKLKGLGQVVYYQKYVGLLPQDNEETRFTDTVHRAFERREPFSDAKQGKSQMGMAASSKKGEGLRSRNVQNFSPSAGFDRGPIDRMQTAAAKVKVLNRPKLPESQGKLIAATRVGENAISLARNIFSAMPSVGPSNALINHTGYYVGSIWTAFSFLELFSASDELKTLQRISDKEGVKRAEGRVTVAGMATTASVSYMAGRIFSTFGVASASFAAIASATILFGIASFFSAVRSGLGFYRSHNFNQKIDEYIENPTLTERQKLVGALRFLRDSVSVTAEEHAEIVEAVNRENPTLSDTDREKLIQQKLTERTEVKLNHMKRRTSSNSIEAVVNQVEGLLQKLEKGEGVEEAKELLKTIQSETRKKMSVYALTITAALVSFVAMVLITFFSLGTFPFVLYAASTAIALTLSIVSLIAHFRKANPNRALSDIPPPSII
jgi:hypothetical protein